MSRYFLHSLRRFYLCFLTALLLTLAAACSRAPVLPPVDDPEGAWVHHQAALADVINWQLGGRIAIQTEDEGWQAGIDWKQQQRDYAIHLAGPLGQGSLHLEGNGRQVALSDGKTVVVDDDAEALLYQQTGWRVPVDALRYWVIGLPAPGPAQTELNDQGTLARLQQADWTIEFRNYARRDALLLPARIFISNHRARIRLVVDRWELL